MTSSTEQAETIATTSAMDTSTDLASATIEEKPVNGVEQEVSEADSKAGKRKRSTKKPTEIEANNVTVANERPKRNLSKREEPPASLANGTGKTSKTKAPRQSVEQGEADADDEQEREKNLPIVYDVADAVWVKMGGHPWWPSLILRDPNDPTQSFTKITGNARPKRMYFVVFYGSTADFAWVTETSVIPYHGVGGFTTYAQEAVDKAQSKYQKEQLTERFQLKVTIGRREDWELAVREADEALKNGSEKRLQDIDPKLQFYTTKLAPKVQGARRTKASITKVEESSSVAESSTSNTNDRSLLAEKTFEFKSEDENEQDTSMDTILRKPSVVKSKLEKQTSNGTESSSTPLAKRRPIRPAVPTEEPSPKIVFGQTANGSSVSYQPRAAPAPVATPTKANNANGTSSSKKRERASPKHPSATSSSDESPAPEFHSASPTVTTKFTTQRKPIIKPQAFNRSGMKNDMEGKHDFRTGFLSGSEEQEVLDALEQLRPTKTFEEAEQEAKRRFEHILCLNLNRTHVDVPQEWFYTFLFSHPSLIIKHPQWFQEKNHSDTSNGTDFLNDLPSSSGLAVLKHQLVVLSKLYQSELQTRSASPGKKRGSSVGKQKSRGKKHEMDTATNESQGEEELIN